MLKHNICVIFLLLLAAACSGSGGDDSPGTTPEPEDIIPTNLSLTITIVGADVGNPNGDGTGVVQFTATATNAVKYGFKIDNGAELLRTNGVLEYTFPNVGTHSYVVSVFAYSSTNNVISTFKEVSVLVVNQSGATWSDEFNSDGAVSSSNWFAETEPPNDGGWFNDEVQHYTNRLDNAYVSNGTLKIVAKKESYTFQNSTKEYTSARLITKNKFDFTYGKVEVRAKLPISAGTWPAIWTLGKNIDQVGWPRCGEIDIMEQKGWDKNKVLATCHWFDAASQQTASYGLDTSITNVSTEFHVYSIEWTETYIKAFVDNVKYYEIALIASLPFNAPQFIILNVAMGGSLGGTIDPGFTQDTMEIDYVRVFQ